MAYFAKYCCVKITILQQRFEKPPSRPQSNLLHPFWTFYTTFPWRSSRCYIFPQTSNIVLFLGICPHIGPRMSTMWTARGKIIFFMETTQSNCFQKKMGHFLMQNSGNHSKFPEKIVQGDLK